MGALWNFFKSGPNATPLTDEKEIKSKFNLFRWQVFGSITIGYALFYVLRLNFSVIKKPLMSIGHFECTAIGPYGFSILHYVRYR